MPKILLICLLSAGFLMSLPTHAILQNEAPKSTELTLLERSDSDEMAGPKIEMVQLPSGILMGKYEATQGQWRAVMGSNPSYFINCGDNCPVERVRWDDVQIFIQRLNKQTGQHFRLPTEDEWYDACQAGNQDSEYCGSNNIDDIAWYDANAGNTTHTIGQKKPNAYGLYDMSGNVQEWTSSCGDWHGDCSFRVVRGGCWFHKPTGILSSFRLWFLTAYLSKGLGFRLAQDP